MRRVRGNARGRCREFHSDRAARVRASRGHSGGSTISASMTSTQSSRASIVGRPALYRAPSAKSGPVADRTSRSFQRTFGLPQNRSHRTTSLARRLLKRRHDDQVVDRRPNRRQRDLEKIRVVDADRNRFDFANSGIQIGRGRNRRRVDAQGQVLLRPALPMPLVVLMSVPALASISVPASEQS